MTESVETVKQVIADLRAWADKNRKADRGDPADKMDALADELEAIPDELVRLYGLTTALPADLGNIHDLPPELIEELSVSKTDELEDQLVTVIKAYDDEASLDQILVGLYRKFMVSQKRKFVQNKLYRMDTAWSVPGKKGVYTTTEPDEPSQEQDDSGYGANPMSGNIDDEIPF